MTPQSRLSIDPTTHLPSIHSFGELSQFLRGAVADEDSRFFSDSMAQLASHVEAIVAALRLDGKRAGVAPLLMDFLTVLRDHRTLVVRLGLDWRGLYEYACYLQALNNFRVLIGQWLLQGGPRGTELTLTAEDFELVAWRTLGEGMLLIDMYEQIVTKDAGVETADSATMPMPRELDEPKVERALQWWQKLRL
jgi:hypothetical protein